MKRVKALVLIVGLLLAITGTAQATQIWDRPEYRPSSNLTLGVWGTEPHGVSTGFLIANPFQINLLYQSEFSNASINALNDFNYSSGQLNYNDNYEYVFAVNASGGMATYTYPNGTQSDSGDANIQWTLSAWHQTILAGTIHDYGTSVYFEVLPTGQYRSFDGSLKVNDVEVFFGNVDCEVLGYTFHGSLGNLGTGSTLEVHNTPLPGSVLLLGSGLAGLAYYRRRKSCKN